jgi:hypothetical protein
MNKRVAPILALLMLCTYQLGSMRVLIPVLNYKLHQDYIAKNLCVNRAKPELQCDGKCHLRTQLRMLDLTKPATPVAPSIQSVDVSPHCITEPQIDFLAPASPALATVHYTLPAGQYLCLPLSPPPQLG